MNQKHTIDQRPVRALVDTVYRLVVDMVPSQALAPGEELIAELARRAGGLAPGQPLSFEAVEALWQGRLGELARLLFRALVGHADGGTCLVDATIMMQACSSITPAAIVSIGIDDEYTDEVLVKMADTLLDHVKTGQILNLEIDGNSLCLQVA